MKYFITYNNITGRIIRTGSCSDRDFRLQPRKDDECMIGGQANDATQKIIGNFSQYGIKPLGFLKIVDKTPEEIKANNPTPPPEMPLEKQPANITNEQWQEMQNKLDTLEKKL